MYSFVSEDSLGEDLVSCGQLISEYDGCIWWFFHVTFQGLLGVHVYQDSIGTRTQMNGGDWHILTAQVTATPVTALLINRYGQ